MAAARPFTPPSGQPTTMTVVQDGSNSRNYPHGSRYTSSTGKTSKWKPYRKEQVETAMEFIPAEDDESEPSNSRCSSASSSRPTSSESSRPNSSNSRRAPPIQRPNSASGRRTPSTPTKQVTLQAVPRKPDRSEEVVEKINWAEHRNLEDQRLRRSVPEDNNLCSEVEQLSSGASSHINDTKDDKLELEDLENNSEESSGDEGDSAIEQGEEEEIKAPNELLMEFITCLQEGDYKNGKKLCQMILMYEPDNPEAIKFQSLIDEKIDLESELADQTSDSESEEGSSDEETDEEASGESGEESSTESSSEEEEDDEETNKDSIKAALEIP